MKIIDLLNKIANGEIDEDIKIEFEYGYNYEYCTIREFFNRYIVDKENLNQEITLENIPKEESEIPENLKLYAPYPECDDKRFDVVEAKINEIIKYLKSKEK